MTKSKYELEIMKASGEILANALEKIKEAVKPGVTTMDLDRIAEDYIRKNGAEPSFKGYKSPMPGVMNFPASICSSVNNEVVHGIPGLRMLKKGDIISIDIGVYYKGYHTDAARTYPVGDISCEAQMLIDVTRQSFYEGIKQAVSGKRIIDISGAIEDYVTSNGCSVVRDFVGHGIGKELHEEPQIPNYRSRERTRLLAGHTLAIEPMVNAGRYDVKILDNKWTVVTSDGSLSAHYENTVVVTDSEPEILTRL